MENVVVSQSVPAEKSMSEGAARQDLLDIFRKSPSYGGPLNFTNGWTFCACCGSQYMNNEGRIGIAAIPGWIRPSSDGAEARKLLNDKYGPLAVERYGKFAYEDTIRKYNRFNKPGVTVAALPVTEAIKIMYDEQKCLIAEGYEIHDKDQGHVVSVIWINE